MVEAEADNRQAVRNVRVSQNMVGAVVAPLLAHFWPVMWRGVRDHTWDVNPQDPRGREAHGCVSALSSSESRAASGSSGASLIGAGKVGLPGDQNSTVSAFCS
jgi:hypothetical protein